MMNFDWNQAAPLDGEMVYRANEHSIDFEISSPPLLSERMGTQGSTSLLFGTLQVEVGIESGELLYPWGLFPNSRWLAGSLRVPDFVPGRVRLALSGDKLKSGVSLDFPGGESWPKVWDRNSGWICVGDAVAHVDAIAVEYARDACVVLVERTLVALWLRPRMR